MKKQIFITFLLTSILISCGNENKQTKQEYDKKLENQIEKPKIREVELAPIIKVGQLLVAKDNHEDPTFSKTIILITLIKTDKIYGVILNKESDEKITDYFEKANQDDFSIGFGGPVQKDDIFFIQTFDNSSENSNEIMNGLYFMGNVKDLKEKFQNNSISKNEVRFFKGLTVWNSKQLDKEVNDWKDWEIIDLKVTEIMNSSINSLWEKYNN